MPPHEPKDAERRIHEVLRALPHRPAPRTLEQRVMAELQRRESRPWWRRSYIFWPMALRSAFLLVAAATAVALAAGPHRVFDALARRFEWIASLQSLEESLVGMAQDVFHAVPPAWFYIGLGTVAVCYAALAGLGAAAYRIFVKPRLRHSPNATP
jgi:hypothetical protein